MLTTNEAAAALGVTRRQVIKLINQGKLKAQKFGRDWQIEQASIEDYQTNRQPVGRPKTDQSSTVQDSSQAPQATPATTPSEPTP